MKTYFGVVVPFSFVIGIRFWENGILVSYVLFGMDILTKIFASECHLCLIIC